MPAAKYIFITDSAFNASYDHSRQVAEAFIGARVSVPWGGFFVPTVPPADYYKLMADAGLSHVEFGTESLSDTILTNLHKPFTARDVFAAHLVAQKAGLHIAHYFLLGGPGRKQADSSRNIDWPGSFGAGGFFLLLRHPYLSAHRLV